MNHHDYVASQRRKAATTAAEILSGTLDIIAGCRVLSGLRPAVDVPDNDRDFQVFVLIDSETDDLPLGSVRELWAGEALAGLEAELATAREWAMTTAEEALRSVVSRFSSV